jgi:hypothetical protein
MQTAVVGVSALEIIWNKLKENIFPLLYGFITQERTKALLLGRDSPL